MTAFPFDYSAYFLNIFVLILFLIALIYAANFLKKRGFIKPLNLIKNSNIKILERQCLENRKGLYLISIGERTWFIATTENSLQVIDRIDLNNLNNIEK